jgi:hypothetical protein
MQDSAPQANITPNCWRWNRRRRGSPEISGRQARSAKKGASQHTAASSASLRIASRSPYHAITCSGSGRAVYSNAWRQGNEITLRAANFDERPVKQIQSPTSEAQIVGAGIAL